MKIRILGNVKHDGVLLLEYEIYDLDEESANKLIEAGNATTKNVKADSPVTKYIPKKVKIGADGMRVPSEQVTDEDRLAAIEGKTGTAVKGVEPVAGNAVQGADEDGDEDSGEQEQEEKGEEEKEA